MAKDRFIGFYWTLPVPTHGFRQLPDDATEAARRSRTIRHQQAIVRRWVEEENGIIEEGDEVVFLELDPDHGTEYIVPKAQELLDRCRSEGKQLLVVALWDMADMGWRRHRLLIDLLEAEERQAEAEERPPLCIVLPPDQVQDRRAIKAMIGNFEYWRNVRKAFTDGKPAHESLVEQTVAELKRTGGGKASSKVLAQALNAQGLLTPNGRPWTAANLRQFLRRCRIAEEAGASEG